MPNCLTASVLFRAYIRRKPSGLLLVTVLSAALPRPVFRMYPADIGEAAAVERSVGHAMCALKKCAPSKGQQGDNPCFKTAFPRCHEQHEGYPDNIGEHSHALLPTVNVVIAEPLAGTLPCFAEQGDKRNDEGNKQCDSESCEKLKRLELNPQIKGFHLSPHGLHQPCNQAAVRSEEQAGAEGYAVKDGHLAASQLVSEVQEAPHEGCSKQNMDKLMRCVITNVAFDKEHRAASSAQTPQQSSEASTQHLRLRVVWQGLL